MVARDCGSPRSARWLSPEVGEKPIHFLEVLIGAIVWSLANIVYLDLKRKGVRGFTRFAAFWVGTPTTWITFFAVSEGRPPTFETSLDDDEALLAEIREDRARRAIAASEETEDRPPV